MKKLLALTLSVLMIMAAFCACNPKTSADDKTVKISTEQVDERIVFNELRNSVNKKYIEQTYYEYERDEQLEKVLLPTEREDVIEDLVEYAVIRQEAEKQEFLMDFDKAKEVADSEYKLLKDDTAQKSYYDILSQELSVRKITEEEYLSMLYDYCYDFYNYKLLEKNFENKNYNSKSEESFEDQFEDYLEKLVEDCSVENID